ncbi:MAG: ACT domain-containing protein [Bacteroidales bacterium]|nr:ACT domain-containing protein [Bacteroidales bacterium]NLK81577.1 ACT domain-containing protein [Bacteroidales bacterium]
MIIKQISVFLEDKSGRLTQITKILAQHDINITALSIADATDYGIIRMIVGRPELAQKVLKEQGIAVQLTEVACMVIPNKPGGLHAALQILTDHNINIDYLYAFADGNKASVVIRSASITEAISVLQKNKMKLLQTSDVYQI